MAAGKSTLSKELAAREDAVLIAQDDLLVALFPGEIVDLGAFVKYSRKQRAWFRQLLERTNVEHELHFIVASDALCKRQLKQRSKQRGLPPGTKWTTDADFDEVTAYFDPPRPEENFNVVRHERSV